MPWIALFRGGRIIREIGQAVRLVGDGMGIFTPRAAPLAHLERFVIGFQGAKTVFDAVT